MSNESKRLLAGYAMALALGWAAVKLLLWWRPSWF